jgi:hypothetical protein
MKKEGYAGTLALANAVNNFWGWSAVDREVVRDDQWQAFHDVYVNDRYDLGLREWFEADNPAALAGIAERMLEAVRKGHWNADARTVRELVTTYTALSERHDVVSGNAKFRDYVASRVSGFGLGRGIRRAGMAAPPAALPPASAALGARSSSMVRGQQLQLVSMQAAIERLAWSYGVLILTVMLAGAYWQSRRSANHSSLITDPESPILNPDPESPIIPNPRSSRIPDHPESPIIPNPRSSRILDHPESSIIPNPRISIRDSRIGDSMIGDSMIGDSGLRISD